MRIDLVRIDFMRIDLVGVDFVRIDLVGAPRFLAVVSRVCPFHVN